MTKTAKNSIFERKLKEEKLPSGEFFWVPTKLFAKKIHLNKNFFFVA